MTTGSRNDWTRIRKSKTPRIERGVLSCYDSHFLESDEPLVTETGQEQDLRWKTFAVMIGA